MEVKIDKISHIGMLKKAVKEFAPEAHLYEIADAGGEGDDSVYTFCLLKKKKASQFKIKSSKITNYSHLKDAVRKAFNRISRPG
jgi:hypothetical protein